MERPGSRTQRARRRRARLGLSRHAWHLPIVSGDPRCQPSPSVSYANGAHGVPEICQKLRYAQPHAVPRHHPLTVLLTCAVVWGREVLHGVVSPPRIDGKDGVAGSIPAGGSTAALTSANAGIVHVPGWFGRQWGGQTRVRTVDSGQRSG